MIRYIAFLRAINVGGHGVIGMEELRKLFDELKFKTVKSYIQTGNVIFDTMQKDSEVVTKKIEKHLHKSLGYEVQTMLRTVPEMEEIIKNNPFKKAKLDKSLHLYLTFLYKEPSEEQKELIIAVSEDIANFRLAKREVYTLYNRNNAKNPFSNAFIEKKLKIPSTTRNWNVINKVLDFAKE